MPISSRLPGGPARSYAIDPNDSIVRLGKGLIVLPAVFQVPKHLFGGMCGSWSDGGLTHEDHADAGRFDQARPDGTPKIDIAFPPIRTFMGCLGCGEQESVSGEVGQVRIVVYMVVDRHGRCASCTGMSSGSPSESATEDQMWT